MRGDGLLAAAVSSARRGVDNGVVPSVDLADEDRAGAEAEAQVAPDVREDRLCGGWGRERRGGAGRRVAGAGTRGFERRGGASVWLAAARRAPSRWMSRPFQWKRTTARGTLAAASCGAEREEVR